MSDVLTIQQLQIDADILPKLEELEERTTIVHCTVKQSLMVRMWPSTFLVQNDGLRKKMLHLFNICLYPEWQWVTSGYQFTLIFEGLGDDCFSFDLFEQAAEPGGFLVKNIQRNVTDVYWLDIGLENLQKG